MDKGCYRLTIRLSPVNATHRKVIEILQNIPKGKRSAAVCEMILHRRRDNDLEERIYRSVRRALADGGYSAHEPEQPKGQEDAGILAFLTALQKEEGEE